MPSRLTLALGALCLGLILALYGSTRWGFSQAAAAAQLRAEVSALEAEVSVLDGRLRGVQAELNRQREKRKGAEHALEQNPEWRDAAVPDAVADGLCSRIRCSPAHPVPTPAR